MKKGQTATEYLIILAVVIVIALIAVGLLGGFPAIGGAGKRRAVESYWATQDIAIIDYAVSESSTDSIIIRNNIKNPVTISSIVINSVELITTATTVGSGGSKTFTGDIAACTAGQGFAYDVTITYTNSKTGASYTITSEGNQLEGNCAT